MGDFNEFKYSSNIDSPEFNKLYDQHFFDSQFSQYLYQESAGSHDNIHDKHPSTTTHNKDRKGITDDKTIPPMEYLHYQPPQYLKPSRLNHGSEIYEAPDVDGSIKRKLSTNEKSNAKKENLSRPVQPIRQNSNPNIPKRKGRPVINKSYSYNVATKNNPTLNSSLRSYPSSDNQLLQGHVPPPHIPQPHVPQAHIPQAHIPLHGLHPSQVHTHSPLNLVTRNSHPPSQPSPSPHIPSYSQPIIPPSLSNSHTTNYSYDDVQAKSLFELTKKKPNFHINLENLPNSPALNSNSSNLSIIDKDLNFDDRFENVTPNMKPPGTNENDYFEEFLIPSNFEETNDLTGFNFNLYDDKGERAIPSTFDNYDSDFKNFTLLNERPPINNNQPSHKLDNNEINEPFNNFDEPDNYNDFTEFNDNFNKKSPLTPLSNDVSTGSPITTKVSPYSTENSHDLNPDLHDMNELSRTTSNQSTSSIKSIDKKKKPLPKGATCPICGKFISRDLSRHLRIHDENGRFRCVYPNLCSHKTGKFNRPYDYKKHLLHFHFKFDDPKGKTATNLTDKLPMMGNCKACDFRSTAQNWIDYHVLTNDLSLKCPFVEGSPEYQ